MRYQKLLFGSLALTLSASALGHGLINEPASRNWICGAVTKPDQAEPGSICAEAFEGDFNGGYQFMSVLTHSLGRKGVSPLPDNVCGFDSSTWDGGPTPWDKPLDWPTHSVSAGPLTISWDIAWGPHFDDTEEFVYYITREDFEYQVGEPLRWSDFEEEPFCDLTGYDDTNPGATPNIIPRRDLVWFDTVCELPERSGRHVIYGEWGRNYFTFERFHGCIDVEYDGGDNGGGISAPVANVSASPSDSLFIGAGTITLSAAASQGDNLSYAWSVDASDSSLYALSSTSGSQTTLTLDEPSSQDDVVVRVQVSNSAGNSTASFAFTHAPEGGDTNWVNLGALTDEARELDSGDQVQLRLVTTGGSDIYLPDTPFEVSEGSADAWTLSFAQAFNAEADDVAIGVLNSDGDVEPAASATANRIYALAPSAYSGAFLQVESDSDNGNGSGGSDDLSCEYVISSDWGAGFVADIVVTNNSGQTVNGWSASWSYGGNTEITNGWNADISGSNPYSATPLDWNASIPAGESVSFGFQGTGSAGNPQVDCE
ncbi:lytic polysaccharide monooxygenase [Marinimicrobium alkaliphilum]|uniref:lytic polysaccharide monooxygenase n=1 Tax=Marinimicrobium alkaliphilum TaxID=2202654 RepID=UPI000DBACDEB|nr:lytic polysaccharide monooxygenase [Marinimicrobium alkaliphilum]